MERERTEVIFMQRFNHLRTRLSDEEKLMLDWLRTRMRYSPGDIIREHIRKTYEEEQTKIKKAKEEM